MVHIEKKKKKKKKKIKRNNTHTETLKGFSDELIWVLKKKDNKDNCVHNFTPIVNVLKNTYLKMFLINCSYNNKALNHMK